MICLVKYTKRGDLIYWVDPITDNIYYGYITIKNYNNNFVLYVINKEYPIWIGFSLTEQIYCYNTGINKTIDKIRSLYDNHKYNYNIICHKKIQKVKKLLKSPKIIEEWFKKYYWNWKEQFEKKLMNPNSETFKMFCEDKYF